MDTATDRVDAEIQADNTFWDSVLGQGGAEHALYEALGGNSTAAAILDTNTADPVWSGDFNGAESRFTEALFVDSVSRRTS